jgi:hypothetical protein
MHAWICRSCLLVSVPKEQKPYFSFVILLSVLWWFRLPFSSVESDIKKGEAIPVTGLGGPHGCETSRLPHFLENPLTDGGEVVSLTLRPYLYPQDNSWYSFLLKAESTPGTSAARRIRSTEKSNDLIRNRTRDFRLVAKCLYHLRYRVPHRKWSVWNIRQMSPLALWLHVWYIRYMFQPMYVSIWLQPMSLWSNIYYHVFSRVLDW